MWTSAIFRKCWGTALSTSPRFILTLLLLNSEVFWQLNIREIILIFSYVSKAYYPSGDMLCFYFAPLINLGSGGIYTDNR